MWYAATYLVLQRPECHDPGQREGVGETSEGLAVLDVHPLQLAQLLDRGSGVAPVQRIPLGVGIRVADTEPLVLGLGVAVVRDDRTCGSSRSTTGALRGRRKAQCSCCDRSIGGRRLLLPLTHRRRHTLPAPGARPHRRGRSGTPRPRRGRSRRLLRPLSAVSPLPCPPTQRSARCDAAAATIAQLSSLPRSLRTRIGWGKVTRLTRPERDDLGSRLHSRRLLAARPDYGCKTTGRVTPTPPRDDVLHTPAVIGDHCV
jgi:hypothetical protein